MVTKDKKARLFEVVARLDKTFVPKLDESPMNVVTNDAGEPIGTEEQPDNFDSQEDDYQNDRPQQQRGIGNFNHIDWQMLHEQLMINTELQAAHKTSDGNLMTANAGDFTDDEGMLSPDELSLLEENDLVYVHDGLPIIENEQYKDFNTFKAKAQEIWNKELQSYNLAGGYKQVHETKKTDKREKRLHEVMGRLDKTFAPNPFDRFTIQVKRPDYQGTIKRSRKGWMLYDVTNSPEEAGPFGDLESLMDYYDIDKSQMTGDYVKNLR